MLQEQFRILGFDGDTAGKSNKSKSRKSRYKELRAENNNIETEMFNANREHFRLHFLQALSN